MSNRYKKANAKYDNTTKTLYIDQKRSEFVPSYAYYVCEYIEQQQNVTIEKVVFTKSNNKMYSKESLKMKYDWSDINELK